jgi:hypothetical protein
MSHLEIINKKEIEMARTIDLAYKYALHSSLTPPPNQKPLHGCKAWSSRICSLYICDTNGSFPCLLPRPAARPQRGSTLPPPPSPPTLVLWPAPPRRRRDTHGARGLCYLPRVAAGPNDDTHALSAAGFLIWVAGVALLLLALRPGRFPGAAAAPARLAAQLVQAAARALF